MDIFQWLYDSLQLVKKKSQQATEKSCEKFNSKGTLLSTFAYTKSLEAGMLEFEREILNIISRLLNSIDISQDQLNKINDYCRSIIIDQTEAIKLKCYEKTGHNEEGYACDYKNNIIAQLELLVEAHKQALRDRKKRRRWEFLRLILSAALGAVFTLFAQYLWKYFLV